MKKLAPVCTIDVDASEQPYRAETNKISKDVGVVDILPNLIVAGDTAEEVLSLAPRVAAALITSMQALGDPLPETLRVIPSLPFDAHVAVPV